LAVPRGKRYHDPIMVRLSRIYTRTGDDGTTGLSDGTRVPKHDARIAAYGTVDELNSTLGIAVNRCGTDPEETSLSELLRRIQNDLFDLGADLSTPVPDPPPADETEALRVTAEQVQSLEEAIDAYNERLAPLTSFVLPGGRELAGWLHLARTVCRRAERWTARLASLEVVNPQSLVYLNRLSDLLFVLARVANDDGREDVLWQPGKHRSG
jgi:cob(I)alamin adenosyltransferase